MRHNELRFSCRGLPKPPPSKPEGYSAAAEAVRPRSAANAG